jgi:hypothetical protein
LMAILTDVIETIEWEKTENEWLNHCSECDQKQINNFQNFCPNCGAEMQ